MKKKTTLLLFLLIMSIYASNINVQITAEENKYRTNSLELTPHESIEITSDGNFTDYGFLGTGTAEDPYVIEGYNITTTSEKGISISGTTKYFVISNCYVDAETYGIYINVVADGTATVVNNTCENNNYRGICLEGSSSSTVTYNMCNNNSVGMWLWSSGSSTVANNTCNNNNVYGICLDNSGSSTVANNTCSNNGGDGIHLHSSDNSTVANNTCNNNGYFGICLDNSGSSAVVNNTFSNNNGYGIYLWSSGYCIVTYNLLQENGGYGVYLEYDSDNNLIHHNTFVDNNLGGTSQGYDDCTNNYWYDSATQYGNDWSDWLGTGSYSIDGSANSVDLYPFGEPVIAEYSQIVLLTLILSIVLLFLTRIISKKSKKE